MLSKTFTYAIVGASNDPSKYRHRVLKDLKGAGFKVTPVNLKVDKILDLPVAHTLTDVEPKPDVIVTVVPPPVTLEIIKQAIELDISNVWMQPGSESEEAVQFCIDNGISVVSNACIMVQRAAQLTYSQDS